MVLLGLHGANPASAAQEDEPARVLVVYSTTPDTAIASRGEREFARLLSAKLSRQLDYYSEFFDLARFPEPEYEAAIGDLIRTKYGSRRLDAVVVMQSGAFQLVRRHRDELFPDTPLIFSLGEPVSPRLPNSTGIVTEPALLQTAGLAVALQPDLRRLFVVSGASALDQRFERRAREQLDRTPTGLEVTYLSGLPTGNLKGRLASLPPQSAVLYTLVYTDGDGENANPIEYLDRVADASNSPVYSWTDSTLGHGVVGGYVKSLDGEIRAVAELTARVLAGERADDIPIAATGITTPQVDWRELQRWHISDARVPPGTTVLFRTQSFWERYRSVVLAVTTIILAQLAFIVGLLVQSSRRKRAEVRLLASEAELRTSHARLRDLGSRLLDAQERERSRLARELHDDISQQVALIAIDVGLAAQTMAKGTADAERLMDGAASRIGQLGRSIHDLSHRLHPARLRLTGLVSALDELCHDCSKGGVNVSFVHGQTSIVADDDLTLSLFRVAQEAIQNAVRHGHSLNVVVLLRYRGPSLELRIVDDGGGFDVDRAWGTGLGLISMRERLEPFGGTVRIVSHPGRGTRVSVRVPRMPDVVPEAPLAAGDDEGLRLRA